MPTYKRLFLTTLLILAAVSFSGLLNAAEVVFGVDWTGPVTRVDKSPLAPSEILEYRLYYAVDGDVVQGDTYTSVSGKETTSLSINLEPRPTPYVVRYAVSAVTKLMDAQGNYVLDELMHIVPDKESALSDIGVKTFRVISTAQPEVPTQLDVTVTSCDGCMIVEQ